MTLKQQLIELEAQQAEDLAELRLHTRTALRAASPRRLIERHPYISVGVAAFAGLEFAPAPRPASSGESSGSKGGLWNLMAALVSHFVPQLGHGSTAPTADPLHAQRSSQFAAMPVSMMEVIQGIRMALSMFQSPASMESGPQIVISNFGTVDANLLSSCLSL